MDYRGVADLNRIVAEQLRDLPADLDLVVGVPRSGLLPATIIALHLNLPLADVEGFLVGRVLATGRRGPEGNPFASNRKLNVLVVDDSVQSGTQMRRTRARLAPVASLHRITYAAVYASPTGATHVDAYLEMTGDRRVFEWNLFHHGYYMERACVDIDGVLCVDPTEEQNDDGERYLQFIESAAPIHLPTQPIGWLVTCRLEKYRDATVSWLERHGVEYRELVMMDLPTKAARVATGSHGQFKAEVYERTGAELFIESSERQAVEIAASTGKPVFCVETGAMLADLAPPAERNAQPSSLIHRAYRKTRSLAARARRRVTRWRLAGAGETGDFVDHDGRRLPLPGNRLCTAEWKDDAFYLSSARAEVERLQQVADLRAGARVLDIGCGQGRLAIGLIDSGIDVEYCGMDVGRESIEWCRRNIAAANPRFRFVHFDIENERYNAHGIPFGDPLQLPFADEAFDVVFLYSVFTHMRSPDIVTYLADTCRVLRSGGRSFFTVYVEKDCENEAENPLGYLVELGESAGTLHRVRFNREYFERLIHDAGLEIIGHWPYSEQITRQSTYLVGRAPCPPDSRE